MVLTITDLVTGAILLLVACVAFLLTLILGAWAIDDPRNRWWGFLPVSVVTGCYIWMLVNILSGS